MKARAIAPATLANVGPGFDVLGIALDTPIDAVEVELIPGSNVITVVPAGRYGDRIPLDPAKNVAAFAARRVAELLGAEPGLALTVEKEIPPGSGLGSSAASAIAGAVATMRALGGSLGAIDLLRIGRDAEALAAGSAHLDNVAPALLGGFVAVVGFEPPEVRHLPFPLDWWLAVILPEYPVHTKDARAVLPKTVPLQDAIANLRDLAAVLDAARRGDLAAFAAHLKDRLAVPYRAPLVPFFPDAERAAIEAGARALCVSGSGPALFAPVGDRRAAEQVTARVVERLAQLGIAATPYVARARPIGALEEGG